MKSKADKQEILAGLQAKFAASPGMVVCKFEGLTVAEDQALRGALRSVGGRYRVVANRLARRAAQDTPFEAALAGQRGMTGLAFPGEDVVGALKALIAYAKDQDHFSFTGGVLEGRELDADQLNELSKMPGLPGLQAQLLYMINSSAQRLLGVLNAPGRELAAVVHQGVEEKKFNE